jgi:hypothetical protein
MIIKLPSRPLLHFIPHPSWGVVGILASFDDEYDSNAFQRHNEITESFINNKYKD